MNELEQAMREVVQQNAYMQHLGIEVESLSADYVCTKMPYKEELTNPYGMFHGGCLYSLCDITAGLGACMGGYFATTVNGSLNFMLPADHLSYVVCQARRLRMGKHLAENEVRILNDQEQLLDSGEFTFFLTDHRVIPQG